MLDDQTGLPHTDRQRGGYRSEHPSNRPRKGWKLYGLTYNDASPHIGVCGSTGGD